MKIITSDAETIIFDSGGMWGISYIGALKRLQEEGLDLLKIKNYFGTSIGAIFSVLLSVGFNLNEIQNIMLCKFDINDIFNPNIFSKTYNLTFNWGLYSADKFEKWFDELIQEKTTKQNITFSEHNQYFGNNVYILATNLCQQNPIIFSHIASPNLTLAKAVCISITIPGVMTPNYINNNYYVDGAFIMSHFYNIVASPEKYLLRQNYNDKFMTETNRNNLVDAFNQINKKNIINLQFDRDNLKIKINNIFDYLHAVSVCVSNYDSKSESNPNTILLDLTNVLTTDFNINLDEKIKLIDIGNTQTSKYF
jgi:NTE family protein